MLKDCDMSAGEISENFKISKPSISHHLNILKQANLVLAEKKGQYVVYTLNTTAIHEIIEYLYDLNQKER